MKIGSFSLNIVSDGTFKLDGGAMFGIVPKPVWEKSTPADDKNRILLGLNALLVRTPLGNVLIDTGIGRKYDERFKSLYAIGEYGGVTESLRKIGLSAGDVNFVIPSHLHFDHAGGATTKFANEIAPTFPKATVFVQESEYASVFTDNPRIKGSYIQDDVVPLEKKNLLKKISGDFEVARGVVIRLTNAHSDGHQIVEIESDGKKAYFLGDMLPTRAHQKPAWCMGYDVRPASVAEFKMKFLAKAFAEGAVLILDHDPVNAFYSVAKSAEDFALKPIES